MRSAVVAAIFLVACGADEKPEGSDGEPDNIESRLTALVLPEQQELPPDATNAVADDDRARELGKKLFYDPRFSGPLLDDSNNGLSGTLGIVGDTGKVACSSCHEPSNGSFVDTRSARGQLSLASGWTHRRTPSLLDTAYAKFLTWDGRRATAFSTVFGVIESPLEFNSSRLFVAQQIREHYQADYETLFGPMPDLERFAAIEAADAGCKTMPQDPLGEGCPKEGHDDEDVTRVVANMGKAIAAYVRQLSCGPSRFDAWMGGDDTALTEQEQLGAELFVGKAGCDGCHSGPLLTDQQFHNVGMPGSLVLFTGVDNSNDPGAAPALAAALDDWLGPSGPFSDADDGRMQALPKDLASLQGAFRTPSLRCIDQRPSYMHNGGYRTLEEVIEFFNKGGGTGGFVGTPEIEPLGLTEEESAALVAFLRALQGPGPSADLRELPDLPD